MATRIKGNHLKMKSARHYASTARLVQVLPVGGSNEGLFQDTFLSLNPLFDFVTFLHAPKVHVFVDI